MKHLVFLNANGGRNIVIDDVFKALSDPIRRSLLETLGKKQFFCAVDGQTVEGICVQDLSSILQLPQSTISRHLTILRQAGLVGHQQKAVWHYYSCVPETIKAVQLWLDSLQPRMEVHASSEPSAFSYLSPETLKGMFDSVHLLDIRPVSEFLLGFIPGSINLPMDEENFVGNLRKVWPYRGDVVLITEEPTIPTAVLAAVSEVGGILTGYTSFKEWKQNGDDTTLNLETADIEDLLKNKSKYVLLDVRSHEEWMAKRIADSQNIPLMNLDSLTQQLDKTKTYVAFCAGVYRGIAGAARLRAQGFATLYLPGGVKTWEEHGGATEGLEP